MAEKIASIKNCIIEWKTVKVNRLVDIRPLI